MIHADFHVHTCLDHGLGQPEDMVQHACTKGLTALGLVGHSQMQFACDYAMTPESEETLFTQARALRTKYAERLEVYCGIEQDYYGLPVSRDYDYIIGSVHYVLPEGVPVSIDSDPKQLQQDVRRFYGGSFTQLARDYYAAVADVVNKTGADIVGHFDLITKFNETDRLFSSDDPAYRQAALDAMAALVEQDPLFEINTGAISRGCRTTPYPERWLLEKLRALGGRIILSSDAHRPDTLVYQFDRSARLARDCGFRTAWVLTPDGFREQPL